MAGGRKYDADRIERVFSLMRHSVPRGHIVRQLASQWGVRNRVAESYVREAERVLKERATTETTLEERRELHRPRAELILANQLQEKAWAAAKQTLEMIAKWDGLGVAQQTTTAVNVYAPNGILTSKAAIDEQMRALQAEQEARAQSLTTQIHAQLTNGKDEDDGDGNGN